MTQLPTSHPPPFPGLILAGTDTGVGKTTIARALLRLAARRNLRLLPFKPVETGCAGKPPQDALNLIQSASIPNLSPDEVCPYSFAAPLTPSVAAKLEGRAVDSRLLLTAAYGLAARGDALLVEGAGGLLSPWDSGVHLGTFAAALRLPLLIVAANRLGTINHTLLTAAECQRRQLPCIGFVLVDTSPVAAPDHDSNAAEIVREARLPFLGCLPHLDLTNVDHIADQADTTLDVTAIFGALESDRRAPIR